MTPAMVVDELQAAEEIFRGYLRRRGLKYTRERRVVLQGVMRNETHFDPEQLLMELRGGGQRVGKATIYRTLPLLIACGIVKPVQFGDKQTRYEHTYGHASHDHMVCLRCRRIIEFDDTQAARLAGRLAREQGFRAVTHRFQIIGLCSDCQRKSTGRG